MDDPPGSRLFVVCGKTAEEDMLKTAFEPYGNVVNVKVIRDKGVAYVKFDKASTAADAMENLNGVVLNNGRGPKLKVLLAESPNSRNIPPSRQQVEMELACDPDNVPPRSRLFLVVPKTADGQAIKEDMNKFPDMEYCKTDLIQSKGVVFCKYSKASAALKAMEIVNESNILAGYRVKCMLAEPKSKRARVENLVPAFLPPVQSRPDFGMGAMHMTNAHGGAPPPPFNAFSGIGGVGPTGTLNSMSGVPMSSLPGMTNLSSKLGGSLVLSMNSGSALGTPSSGMIGTGIVDSGLSPISATSVNGQPVIESPTGLSNYGLGPYGATDINVSQNKTPPTLSKLRLFVVVYKGVSEEMLSRLFRRFPGMEYCDLKKDKKTNKSKGYCYVNYSTHEAAAQAVQCLNGIEFPPHSSHRLKVMFAEPLVHKPIHGAISVVAAATPPSLEDGMIEETESTNGNGGSFALSDTADDTKVYTIMSRPLPSWALEFVFSPYGAIEEIRLDNDKRMGSVKFSRPESALRAIQDLQNGYDILGQVLRVAGSPLTLPV
eukprot:g3577.t1